MRNSMKNSNHKNQSNSYTFPHQLVYTVPQLAKLLQVNPQFIRDLVTAGLLVPGKYGQIKFDYHEVERFLDEVKGMDFTDPLFVKELAH